MTVFSILSLLVLVVTLVFVVWGLLDEIHGRYKYNVPFSWDDLWTVVILVCVTVLWINTVAHLTHTTSFL